MDFSVSNTMLWFSIVQFGLLAVIMLVLGATFMPKETESGVR